MAKSAAEMQNIEALRKEISEHVESLEQIEEFLTRFPLAGLDAHIRQIKMSLGVWLEDGYMESKPPGYFLADGMPSGR